MNLTLENLIRCRTCTHGIAFHYGGRCDTRSCACEKSDRMILSETLRADGKRRYDGYYALDDSES